MAKAKKEGWNVWIEGDPTKKGYFSGRDEIERLMGSCSGSGSMTDAWDVSYHKIVDESAARMMGDEMAKLDFVKEVYIYNSKKPDVRIYLKGKNTVVTKPKPRSIKAQRNADLQRILTKMIGAREALEAADHSIEAWVQYGHEMKSVEASLLSAQL